jgi:cytochrome P450
MFETDPEKHAFLRRLVGSGMNSPEALRQALRTIEQTANESITQLLQQSIPVKMEDICTEYTLEMVRKQLLGLDELSKDEHVILREKLKTWLSALYSLLFNIRPPSFIVKRSKPYKARLYIEAKLEEKIDSLLKNGPDSSTLSEMVFAVEEDGNERKLTREQVIENALVLVSAGTETSASTLTLAMLLLGLHSDAFTKLVEEQLNVQSEHGDALSLQILDKECPYLDGVVNEALRLGAVTGGFPRRARETIVIDGKQVPKGWPVFSNIRLTHQLDPVTRLPDDSNMSVYKGFQPERWLNSETVPSDFIPFGAGPRYCLGAKLAKLEIKAFLAMFARRIQGFRLVGNEVNSKIHWNPRSMIPKPANGVIVEILSESNS